MDSQSRQLGLTVPPEHEELCKKATQPARAAEILNDESCRFVSSDPCDHNYGFSQRQADPSTSAEEMSAPLLFRSSMLQLFVRLPVDKTLTVSMKAGQTGKDLHNLLECRTGIPANQQVLLFNNRKLTATSSLFEQRLADGSTLELSLVLAGGSDEALSERNLRFLARRLADMWRELAYELGMRNEEVRAIASNFPNHVVEQGFQMLCQWRQKSGISANVPDLIAALREIELNDAADKLLERLTGVPGPYSQVQGSNDVTKLSTSQAIPEQETSSHHTTDAATELTPALEEVAVSQQLLALAAEPSGNEATSIGGGEEAGAITQSELTVDSDDSISDAQETSTVSPYHKSSPSAGLPNTAMLVKLESILSGACSDSDNVNILITNGVPETLRGDQGLQFLLDFNWSAVLDFDSSSEDGGLLSLASTMPDPQQSRSKLMEIKDFLDKSVTNHPAEIGLHSKKKPWVFVNGRKNFDSQPDTYVKWMRLGYRMALEIALATYQTYCPHLMFIILLLSDNNLQHLANAVEYLFCRQLTKQQSFFILSSRADRCKVLCELSRTSKELAPLCFVLPLEDIKAAFMNTSSIASIASESTEEVRLPTSDGGNVKVPPQKVKKWDDLDILSMTQCENSNQSLKDITLAEDNFYKGHEPTWLNFFHGHDIQRTECATFMSCIKEQLSDLMNMHPAGPERLAVTSVRTVILNHQSGSGGTTVGRRLLWNLRTEYRCAELTALSEATRKAIHDFQAFGESMVPQSQLRPLVLLADGHAVINLQRLLLQLDRGNVKCVVVCVQAKQSPLLVSHRYGFEQSDVSHDLAFFRFVKSFDLPEHLDKAELNRVKNVVKKLKGAAGSQVMENVERSKLFIYLGLELFGGNCKPGRLANFVKYHMEAASTTKLHQKMLRYCSLVYLFSRKVIPRGCFKFKRRGYITVGGGFEVDELTSSVSDLLLLCDEQLDPPSGACYRGYRPAHALVAREILKQTFQQGEQSLPRLCHSYIDDMLQNTDYATRHLMDVTILLFQKREHSSEFTEQEDESSPLEFQDQGHPADGHRSSSRHSRPQHQNRYSPLITAVLTPDDHDPGTDSKSNALSLIFSLCQTVINRERDDIAYVWQLMARFLALEYQELLIPYDAASQLTALLGPEAHGTPLVPHAQDCQEVTGCTAAIICIDQAIKLESNNTHCHCTKGLIYKLRLQYCHHSKARCSQEELIYCVDLAKMSGQSYEKARITKPFNWHAYLGNVDAYVTLLEITKNASFFQPQEVVGDSNRNFLLFLEGKWTPRAFADDDHAVEFIRNARKRIEQLFDRFFEQENRIKEFGHGEYVLIKWMSARERMNEMQRKFYTIVERKLQLHLWKDQSRHASSIQYCEGTVRDILFEHGETAYSPWLNVNEEDMQSIIEHLTMPVMRSSVESTSDYSKVAFVRACLECQKKPDRELESKLPFMVQQWVDHCSNFDWAHYFNYMLHFPHENSLPCSGTKVVKRLLQACQKCVEKYGESKKSKPRYFIGQGKGIGAFVPARVLNMPGVNQAAQDYKTKTDFWRSSNVTSMLMRLAGTKFKTGHIRYREDLMIKFDNALFPETSQERVYFYIGFTFHGIYAFDPLSEEDLKDVLRQADQAGVNQVDEEPGGNRHFHDLVKPAHSVKVGSSTDLVAFGSHSNIANSAENKCVKNSKQSVSSGTERGSLPTATVRTDTNDQFFGTMAALDDKHVRKGKLSSKCDQGGQISGDHHAIQSELTQSAPRGLASRADEKKPTSAIRHSKSSEGQHRLPGKREAMLKALSGEEENLKVAGKLRQPEMFRMRTHSPDRTSKHESKGNRSFPQSIPVETRPLHVDLSATARYQQPTSRSDHFVDTSDSTDHIHQQMRPAPNASHFYNFNARIQDYGHANNFDQKVNLASSTAFDQCTGLGFSGAFDPHQGHASSTDFHPRNSPAFHNGTAQHQTPARRPADAHHHMGHAPHHAGSWQYNSPASSYGSQGFQIPVSRTATPHSYKTAVTSTATDQPKCPAPLPYHHHASGSNRQHLTGSQEQAQVLNESEKYAQVATGIQSSPSHNVRFNQKWWGNCEMQGTAIGQRHQQARHREAGHSTCLSTQRLHGNQPAHLHSQPLSQPTHQKQLPSIASLDSFDSDPEEGQWECNPKENWRKLDAV